MELFVAQLPVNKNGKRFTMVVVLTISTLASTK
jgi:hypothetical protein